MSRFILIVLLVLGPTACATGSPASAERSQVLVSAASSLADAFADLEAAFEAQNPDLDVVLNLAGSATLREQILGGAPVDVFAPANPAVLEPVLEAGLAASTPVVFARNQMALAVPAGNPAGIRSLSDLAHPELLVGLCAEGVPCGDLARRLLTQAGVAASLDTNEPDVRAVLAKLEAGELDAGLVYVTDVAAAGSSVETIPLPPRVDAVTDYPIASLSGAPDAATRFVEFVLSAQGRRILAGHGFRLP